MIEKLFKPYDAKTLTLDNEFMLQKLGGDFLKHVLDSGGGGVISNLKLDGDRRCAFAYYRINRNWYSFAWNKQKQELIYSKKVNGVKWRFIVGWRPEEE